MGTGRKKGPGGGGAALNFKVVGNPQPANPKENTIWLNTDVDITGQYLQAEQPEEMAEGEVWISTGTASQVAFNALKKGTVMVYPLAAKQMQSGTLVDVTSKSWQNGKWVDWVFRVDLYLSGNQYEGVTGGWKVVAGAISASLAESGIIFTGSGTSNRDCSVYTNNKIDVSSINRLIAEEIVVTKSIADSGYNGTIDIGLTSNNSVAYPTEWIARTRVEVIGTHEDVELDLSNISGEYYICVHAGAALGQANGLYLQGGG